MWFYEEGDDLGLDVKQELMARLLDSARHEFKRELGRALLLPPDFTRYHSGAGKMTEMVYNLLPDGCEADVIPTLGQHVPMTGDEIATMFGSMPHDIFHVHDWRRGCKRLGEISAGYVREATAGAADFPVPVEVNRMAVEKDYDLIVSIGHVVPHEVLGFANYNKNFFIGLGGKEMINSSHFLAASYGIERNLGRLVTPLRQVYNKAGRECLSGLPIVYVLVVLARNERGELTTRGIYVGEDEETYLRAAKLSRKLNLVALDKPIKKIVAFMDGSEFKSTWVANKAIYRSRMAIADGGKLLVIAPGVERFGEDRAVDALIRKYGYVGAPRVVAATRENADLQDLRVGAAHLIHGSSEGRFTIAYAPGHLTKKEIESVNFQYADLQETLGRYDPNSLAEGWNTLDNGEEIYYISAPATGLWALKSQLV